MEARRANPQMIESNHATDELSVTAVPLGLPSPPVSLDEGRARSEMTEIAMNAPSCARNRRAKITSFHLHTRRGRMSVRVVLVGGRRR